MSKEFKSYFKEITPKKVRKQYRYVKKATGEREVFQEILRERQIGGVIYSEVSGERIHNPNEFNCAHILSKAQNKYPLFKLRKDNIAVLTVDEHHYYDNGLKEELKKDARWKWLFEKAEELKIEYNQINKVA